MLDFRFDLNFAGHLIFGVAVSVYTEEHFLQEIRENWNDRLPRLAYADWLAEQDDPRSLPWRISAGEHQWSIRVDTLLKARFFFQRPLSGNSGITTGLFTLHLSGSGVTLALQDMKIVHALIENRLQKMLDDPENQSDEAIQSILHVLEVNQQWMDGDATDEEFYSAFTGSGMTLASLDLAELRKLVMELFPYPTTDLSELLSPSFEELLLQTYGWQEVVKASQEH